MTTDTAPAIRTQYDGRYSDIELIEKIGSDTTFHRGFGETGTSVKLVDTSAIGGCPRCGTDEMVLSQDLNPEAYDDALFYCTNLACPHFVGDEVEYDMNKIRADKPEVWDNTAECPECDKRYTVEVDRHRRVPDDGIITSTCGECVAKMESGVDA